MRYGIRRGWRGVVPVALLMAGCSGAEGESERVASTPPEYPGFDGLMALEGFTGTFVLADPEGGLPRVHHAVRAGTPLVPASTFKIPNALIALETGVASGPDFPLTRDPAVAPEEAWWPAGWREPIHTLESAFRGSVVWYYQEVARRIGEERMGEWLERFEYGNGDLSAGIDQFWLHGPFALSALDQIAFLERFLAGTLPISDRSAAALREMMVLDEGPGYRLSGKTGWANFGEVDRTGIGWLVGFLEREEGSWIYAMNLDIHEPSDAAERMRVTRGVLEELGLLGN